MRITKQKKFHTKKAVVIGLSVSAVFFGTSGLLLMNQVDGNTTPVLETKVLEKTLQKELEEESHSNGTSSVNTPYDTENKARPTLQQVQFAQENIEGVREFAKTNLSIASIGLENMPIFQRSESTEINNNLMLYGGINILANQQAGQGNYTIASHNMGQSGLLFTDLNNVNEGDRITLNDGKKSFEYEVFQILKVHYENTDCLNQSKDPILTLVTCETARPTPYRIVVQAKII